MTTPSGDEGLRAAIATEEARLASLEQAQQRITPARSAGR
jgi:hypothetical protein